MRKMTRMCMSVFILALLLLGACAQVAEPSPDTKPEQNVTVKERQPLQEKEEKEEERVPEAVITAANAYVNKVAGQLGEVKTESIRYDHKGVRHYIEDETYRKQIFNKSRKTGIYSQFFPNETYGTVWIEKYSSDYKVYYKTFEKVYRATYTLTVEDLTLPVEFSIIENGSIYDEFNSLERCEQDQEQCPPFNITKVKAKEIYGNGESAGEPRITYHIERGFRGYVWEVTSCPHIESTGPGPIPQIGCRKTYINVDTGRLWQ